MAGFWRNILDSLAPTKRSLDAASVEGINSTWRPPRQSPDSLVAQVPGPLRDRSRDLYANDPYYQRAIREYVLGIGSLEPRPATPDPGLNRAIRQLWADWALEAWTSGDSFALGAETVTQEWLVAGDGLVLRRFDRSAYGVPLRLQALAADFLDNRQWKQRETGKNRVVNGKEIDEAGRTVAYWLYPSNPNDAGGAVADSVRIPADRVAHIFSVRIPGQVSGIPELAPVMGALRDLKDYAEAHIHRKILESSFGPIIHDADPSSERYAGLPVGVDSAGRPKYSAGLVDTYGNPIVALDSGQAAIAPPGASVTFPQPTIASDFTVVYNDLLHRIAAGAHIPYARLAANLAGYNYSSARIDQLPFKAVLGSLKMRAAQGMSVRVWRWWVEAAVLSGQIPQSAINPRIGTIPYKIPAPAFQEADLGRMVTAVRDLVRIGGESWRDAVESYFGGDVEEIIAENAADFAAAAAAGVVLDSNPGQTSLSGGVQQIDLTNGEH